MRNRRTLSSHLFGITFLAMAFSAIGLQDGNIMSIFTVDGLPPQRGEKVAENYAIDFSNQRYEIDGVCKYDAESAMCWRPDGSPNPELTQAISNAIRNMDDSNYRTWTLTFGKKRRTLFFKETRYNRNNNNDARYGNIFRPNQQSSKFTQGWTQSGSPFNYANYTSFDGSTTTWQTVEGIFEKSTKEFPFRYVFQEAKYKTTHQPLKPGRIDIEGNVIEITSIVDHPKPKPVAANPGIVYANPYGVGKNRPPVTDINIKVVSMKNPFSIASIRIGDENGKPYDYVDEKGNSVAVETVNQWYQKHPNNMPGKMPPYYPAGNYSIDAMYTRENTTNLIQSYLPKEKCKTLVIMTTARDFYVFDHVMLDPK